MGVVTRQHLHIQEVSLWLTKCIECLSRMQESFTLSCNVPIDNRCKNSEKGTRHTEGSPVIRVQSSLCFGDPNQEGVRRANRLWGMKNMPKQVDEEVSFFFGNRRKKANGTPSKPAAESPVLRIVEMNRSRGGISTKGIGEALVA